MCSDYQAFLVCEKWRPDRECLVKRTLFKNNNQVRLEAAAFCLMKRHVSSLKKFHAHNTVA